MQAESGNRSLIAQVDFFRQLLKPRYVIFHSGISGTIEESIRQIMIFQNEFRQLFGSAVIENKPKIGVKNEICIGSSPEEIKNILDKTGLEFCCDIGHAVCFAVWAKRPWEDVVREFLAFKPSIFHLSDGNVETRDDDHEHLGKGNYDLAKMASMIPTDSYVSIETKKASNENLDDFREDVEFLRRIS